MIAAEPGRQITQPHRRRQGQIAAERPGDAERQFGADEPAGIAGSGGFDAVGCEVVVDSAVGRVGAAAAEQREIDEAIVEGVAAVQSAETDIGNGTA
jgi:hypothetical protein